MVPKKVIREIQSYCRIFLWTGDTNASKKALLSWENLCLPRVAEGLNLKNMEYWNKAAVCKLLWAITHKKDKLWVRWVNSYYVKGRPLTGFHCTANMSWPLRKILGCMDLIENVGGWTAVMKHVVFSINLMYQKLSGDDLKVPWRRVVSHNPATPKSLFILWIAIWRRLPTLDRLLRWKVVTSDVCPICQSCVESIDHLFF